MPDTSERPERGADGSRDRSVLARKWAYLLLSRMFVPVPQEELERELLALVDAAFADACGEPFSTKAAHDAGERLAELGCVGDEALPCSMDVLGKGLLALPGVPAQRVVPVLGAFAGGFTAAVRTQVFDQQQAMNLSLLKAVRESRWHLAESEARFDEVAMSSASGIMITDVDGRLLRVNAAVADMLGYTAADLTGKELFDVVHPEYAAVLREDYAALLAGMKERVRQSQLLLCRNGDVARVSLTATLLRGADDRPGQFVTVVEDGTELLLLQSELNRQALHDALTGLPNRQLFGTHLESALRRADPEYGVTLLHLDLDAFALICNGLGLRVGERLLVEVARRLQAVVADERAMVSRLGSDEFGIVVENTATTPPVAALVAAINAGLAECGDGIAVSASIGVVHRPEPAADAADVLRVADVTLRKVQTTGPAQWALFHPDQDERAMYTMAAGMSGAWDAGEIEVVYRPLVRLADGGVDGVEALLRWDRGGDVVPHARCVALADMSGLILVLGDRLLRAAGRDVQWWRQRFGELSLAVALTAHQAADADLVSRVVPVLDETGLPPERLTLWVPAGAVVAPEVVDNVRVLADIGVRTGLDGFGVDLGSVLNLPVRSVRWRSEPVGDALLADAMRAACALARRRGAQVVVDGVESSATAEWWRAVGADAGLGDVFGGPRPAGDVVGLLGGLS
ncbi:MAG TPA: EAL domain-containing protein [Pseudonocardiaceae bacterium]|nr:EAL domain-containing protein [Pseudonocardiaceae bacterium]